jgi:SAM-dependent methyltransferase
MAKWSSYFYDVGDTPNGLVPRLLESQDPNKRKVALDLGAGNLRDSKYLLAQGFETVIAVDTCEQSIDFVIPGIDLRIMPIQYFKGESESIDFAISCNTLFFLRSEEIKYIFKEVYKCLKVGGVFACNVLAPDDAWVKEGKSGVYALKKKRIEDFCACFTKFEIREKRRDGETSAGTPAHK